MWPKIIPACCNLLVFGFLAACISPVVPENRALIRHSGMQFWIEGSGQQPLDRLELEPGTYMIRFRETHTGVTGAAYCRVEAGQQYRMRILEKQYLPAMGRYVYSARCYQNQG